MKIFSKAVVLLTLSIAGGAALTAVADSQRMVPTVAPNGTITASVDLGKEFPQIPALKGYVLTQTFTTVAPNTGRPWHSHVGNPEIVRILSGTLTDARNGGPRKEYGPGSTLINAQGTQHMWANLGTEPVVFIATAVHASH